MASPQGVLGPERMWIVLAVVAVLTLGWRLLAPAPQSAGEPVALLNVFENAESHIEKVSRVDCQRQDGRLWVVLEDGVECMSYVAAGATSGADTVLVFLDGDVPDQQFLAAAPASARAGQLERAGRLSTRYELPVVIVGRPGLMGSTGFHLVGGRRDEATVIDGTLAALREKLGFRRMALAGQSGGSRLIAQMMVLGHHEIACAAMGSGVYGVPGLVGGGSARTNLFGDPGKRYLVPLQSIGQITVAPGRRSFVIGDPADRRAPFIDQREWADKLAAAGHHAVLIEAHGKGEENHGLALEALTAAALCARGRTDAEITAAVKAM